MSSMVRWSCLEEDCSLGGVLKEMLAEKIKEGFMGMKETKFEWMINGWDGRCRCKVEWVEVVVYLERVYESMSLWVSGWWFESGAWLSR